MFAKILGDNLIICEKRLKDLNCNVTVCTRQNIYLPLQWYEINKVYDNMTYNLSNENVGIHWFNGATVSKNYINNLDTRLEDFKVTCYLDSLIKKYIVKEKISIVMAYFNRKEQLEMTLESIKKSKYPNKEIIIVDDNSRQDQRVELFIDNYRNDLDIKVITIEEKEKTWVNPCIPFNIGIKEASGEIIVLQNPEVMHVGDCLTFVNDNLEEKDWISFNCYGSPNFQFNKQIEKKTESEKFTDIYNLTFNIGGNSVKRDNVGGWLNHYEKHFVGYHYLAAIYKSDIYDYLDGGFNEKFKHGIGVDDDELIKRLIFNKFNFKISKFESDIPFCIHLYHEKPESVKNLDWRDNKKIFIESCINMNMTPENNIHLAPKNEIPMARRILI
jgi:glycosyltransferase involved in cell wall biosynthesis